MVNENEGKKYEPKAVYDRKLLRSMIRAGLERKFGYHKVNKNVTQNFKRMRSGDANV